jgi:hypothetical protein
MKPIRLEVFSDDGDVEDFPERLTITIGVHFLKKMLGRMDLVREIKKVDPHASAVTINHPHPGSFIEDLCHTAIYFGDGDSVEETPVNLCKHVDNFKFIVREDMLYAEFQDRRGFFGHTESISRGDLEHILREALLLPGSVEAIHAIGESIIPATFIDAGNNWTHAGAIQAEPSENQDAEVADLNLDIGDGGEGEEVEEGDSGPP